MPPVRMALEVVCIIFIDLSCSASPPCRSGRMLAKALGVKLNLKPISVRDGENRTPEFLKLNPQHSIPTLVDGDFSIWESRVILTYLADKYGKDDSLYPKDIQKRAIVDQRLYFDIGTLSKTFGDYFMPQLRQNLPADPEKLQKWEDAIELLDGFLSKSKYAAGDKITIADYALLSTYSTFLVTSFDPSRFTNINRWYELCRETLIGFDVCEEGVELMKQHIKKMKEAHQH